MFKPNDRVLYRDGDRWVHATVIRVTYPFTRTNGDNVEFSQAQEPTALIRLDSGGETVVSCAELRPT